MELENFKMLWQEKKNASSMPEEIQPNYSIDMHVTNEIAKLNSKNLSSAKNSEMMTAMLFGVLAFALLAQFLLPDEIKGVKKAMPVLIMLIVSGLVANYLTRESKRIFDIDPIDNIHASVARVVVKWNRWYVKTNVILAVLLPILVYILLFLIEQVFSFQMGIGIHVLICILTTAVLIIGIYFYYKQNYITKIKELKRVLVELDSEERNEK